MGFDHGALYAARFHPRGLKMSIYAASDALNSMGLSWQLISEKVKNLIRCRFMPAVLFGGN